MAKQCASCKVVYADAEAGFSRDAQQRDGLSFYCRACRRVANNARYHANLEVGREQRRRYYEQNKEKRLAKIAEYQHAHPEQRKAINQKWNKKHPDKLQKYRKAGRATRVARLGGPRGEVTLSVRRRMWSGQDGKCYWCDSALPVRGAHTDHVVPVVLGGKHTKDNLVLACASCNRKKGRRHPADFNAERWKQFQATTGRSTSGIAAAS